MLPIVIPPCEEKDGWDEKKKQFYHLNAFKGCTLNLEHSLISVYKWEAKWHVSFIATKDKTEEQSLYYIKCMTINKDVPDEAYNHLTVKDIQDISAYINDPMTATTINNIDKKTGGREIVTAELIYYWMIALNIPFECQKWHFNQLITLIEVCNAKNTPPKKMSKSEVMARNRALNQARRAKYNTKG